MKTRTYPAGFTLALLVSSFLLLLSSQAPAEWPAELTINDRPTLAPLLENVTPAVVNVGVTGSVPVQSNPMLNDPFFRRFFNVPEQPRSVPQQSVGSGVIVDAEKGYVLTNHHVIKDADEIEVTLQDRRRFDAELIGSDEGTDIALLHIDADDLTALKLGDSETVRVGDFVLAVGNPFGLGQTVTSGIISALGRSGLNIEGYEDFIQTDASINPGNSGGALLDIDGDLIGINTAIIAPSGGNVGIGFAIPVSMAKAVMDQLLEFGEVRRGRLGIIIQDVTPELAEALDLDTAEGVVITQVQPGSAAEDAGLAAGDVIVAVDDTPVVNSSGLRNRIGLTPLGEDIDVAIMRDGRRRTIEVEVGTGGQQTLEGGDTFARLQGAEFRNMDSGDPRYRDAAGPVVANIEQGSPAWRNGLREGDVILGINRTRVTNVDELSAVIERSGSTIALDVLRGNTRLFIVVQ
jgi:Do/DeqQ family serine protease